MNQTELLPGVLFQSEQTTRFKSGCLSFSLLRPLCREEAAKNALLANILTMATAKHPDMQSMSRALDELYGASLGPMVRKNGEIQTCGIYMSFLEDRFAMEGDRVLAPMLELLREVLLEPLTENGAFQEELVELEKENLINTIESSLNDKRVYADKQMIQALCRDDLYSVPRLGTREDVEAITAQNLYEHYKKILATSQIRIFYAGSAPAETVQALLMDILRDMPREELAPLSSKAMARHGEPQYKEETMDLTQGKLSMGFTTGITPKDPDYIPLMVMNTLFGGDLTSKLFMNVREKLSLCYYAASAVSGAKGLMTVSSGIDTANYQQAVDEILRQLDACKNGDITKEELTDAQQAILSSIATLSDSLGRMEDFSMFRVLTGFPMDKEAYQKAVEAVTVADCARAARQVQLDTIFFLKGAAS